MSSVSKEGHSSVNLSSTTTDGLITTAIVSTYYSEPLVMFIHASVVNKRTDRNPNIKYL